MRVTANTFPNSLIDQLNRLATRQYRLQNQAATGQKLSRPEDDPTAMRRVMDMQAEAAHVSQYQRNIQRHQETSTASFAAFKALKKISDRASEIATLADGLKSPDQLQILADEINELIRQGVQVANTQNRGDYLFAGTRTDLQPFSITQDPNGLVTAVTYQGNTDTSASEIAQNVTLDSQTLGANTSGSGSRGLITDSRSGADLFNHLISLRDNLRANHLNGIATNRTQLAQDEDNLIFHLGTSGAIQARLEATLSIAKNRSQSLETLVSRESDADLSQTLVRLSEVQTAYQAALQSGGTILNKSLLDFLR
jgi:flagellar hook-associated protein 3 FlgL